MTIDTNELRRRAEWGYKVASDIVIELLDRLEAAEKERDDVAQQLVQSEIGKREISEAHNAVTRRLSVLADENAALRAKIEQMEKQDPIDLRFPSALRKMWASYEIQHWIEEQGPLYALPGAQDGIRWDLLPGWLIDHHEGAALSEELLQRALAEMLAEMPKPEVQTALRERVMDAIAEALGDAYDCTRHWSAWGYGTMSQDDFSLVADDSDRIGEIADAAIGVIGAQPAPSVPDGWKLVPIEPTPGMIDAAEYVDWGDADVRGSCINAWNRMLSVAPEAKP